MDAANFQELLQALALCEEISGEEGFVPFPISAVLPSSVSLQSLGNTVVKTIVYGQNAY